MVPEEEEDMVAVKFKGVDYVVGETSKKVYRADEENGDEYVGLLTDPKFKGMKMPKVVAKA
jgi:hypothetical protein